MGLFDLWGKAKKKLEDWAQPEIQTVSRGLSGIANNARNFVQDVEQIPQRASDYFGNDATAGGIIKNTFKPSSLYDSAKTIENGGANIVKYAVSHPFQTVANAATLGNYNRVVNSKPVKDYFAPAPQMRARDIVREIPTGINETAKGMVQGAARFGISLAELPKTLATSKASGKYYDTPVGRINSFQSEAQNRVERGDPLWKAIGNPALDTVLAGADVGAVAKPILNTAKSLSRFGKVGNEVANIADDLTKPLGKTMKITIPRRTEPVSPNIFDAQPGQGTFRIVKDKLKKVDGFQMTRDTKPFNMPEQQIDVPFEFKSKLLNARPGLTIKDVSKDAGFAERNAAKTGRARELVNNQIENQRQGLSTAEKGFVSPEAIKTPETPKSGSLADAFKEEMKANSPFGPVEQKLYDDAIKPLPPLKPGEVNLDQVAEMQDAARGIDDVPFKGDEFAMKPLREVMAERKAAQVPRPGEALEKNINNRPYVREPRTVSDIYETYVAPAGEKTKNLANTAGDLLDTTPQGRNPRLEAGEPNIINQPKWLRSIGAARNKKDIERIGFKEGQGIIDDWRMKNQPNYPQKKAEIDRFKNFVADYKSSEEAGIKRGVEYLNKYSDIPGNKGSQVIHFLENPGQAPADVAPHVENLKNEFASFFDEAKGAGLDVGNWRDYVTHIWAESPQEVAKKIAAGLRKGIITADDLATPNANTTPFFRPSNSRTLKTYELGERIGLHMKYDQPAQIVAHYAKQLEKAKSVMRNIGALKEAGDIVEGVQPGMKPLTAVGMEGMSAEPKLADKLNNAFRDQSQEYYSTTAGKILEKAAGASRWLKEALMSGGIPASTVNSYGIGMTLKEIGTLSPTRAKNAIYSFVVANSPSKSRQFFIDNLGQIEKIKSKDLTLSTMLDNGGFIDKGFLGNVFGAKGSGFGGHWNAIMNEPTFGRYLPMNQIKFFNSIESRLLKKGYSADAAVKTAVKELKEGMGLGSAAKASARPQWEKDVLETAFFAPTHRANMFRVFGNAAKSLGRNPLKPGNQSAAQFLAGGLAVYGMYDYINYKNTGHHMWDNPTGKKFEAYISTGKGNFISIPFMPSVATMPRLGIDVGERLAKGDLTGAAGRAWQGSGSLLTKPLMDVAMNSDYFDRPIANEKDDPSKQWGDRAVYLGKSYSGHPWIKAGIDAAGGKPLDQVAVQATEAPIRFNTEDKLASGKFWDTKNKVAPIYEKFVKLSKEDPAKAEIFYKENQDAIESYPKINDGAQLYSDLKKEGSQDQFGGIVKNDGFNFSEKPKDSYIGSILGKGNVANAQETDSSKKVSLTGDKVKQKYEIERKMEELANSDGNFMDLNNGWVLRKGEDGNVTKQRRDSFDAEKNRAELSGFKRNDDLKKWKETAEKQFALLNKRLIDPSIDDADKAKIQNEIDILGDDFAKFNSYGGFKKGSGAGSGKSKITRNPYVFQPVGTFSKIENRNSLKPQQLVSAMPGTSTTKYRIKTAIKKPSMKAKKVVIRFGSKSI